MKKYKGKKYIFKEMAKMGLNCPKCGLWLPKIELKKGLTCPECKTFCQIKKGERCIK